MKKIKYLFLFLLFTSGMVMAQTTNATEEIAKEVGLRHEAQSSVETLTRRLDLQEIMDSGGVIFYVLAVMSVAAVMLILMFSISLNNRRIAPASFVREIEISLKNGDFEEAVKSCEGNSSPVSAITLSALSYLERAGDDADPELLRQVVEGEGVRQVGRLQSQITYLMDIGVIAPMVGLLGTVMGMLTSFSGVALNTAQAKSVVLADGIAQALITTAGGLIVAIPAMIAYSLFRGRLSKLTANLELVAAEIVTTLAHRKK
ncbi:MotA/TolQ/ExbB proton channel family protein [Kiritimatiellaeota bacterium B1221]|nr:MotA/TolQ/ExbB proton channel family protein [Kiritimatiellaeota bacterium B1221]